MYENVKKNGYQEFDFSGTLRLNVLSFFTIIRDFQSFMFLEGLCE